ncbi:hypothetical protein LINGRAHAP2_LOCUS2911 [Linum grandiflorum]
MGRGDQGFSSKGPLVARNIRHGRGCCPSLRRRGSGVARRQRPNQFRIASPGRRSLLRKSARIMLIIRRMVWIIMS